MVKVDKDTVVRWEAEEYVQREKNVGWYIGLIFVTVGLVALSVWQQWWIFIVVVVLSAIALILYSVRPPRKLQYTLSARGLQENERLYKFEDFKAFGVIQDDVHFAIVLRPRKRFSPSVTVFFPEQQGEEIVDMFGLRLQMEEVKLDLLDKIVKFLRI